MTQHKDAMTSRERVIAAGEYIALVKPPPPPGVQGDKIFFVKPMIDPRFSRFETSKLKFTVTRDRAQNQFHIQVDRPRW